MPKMNKATLIAGLLVSAGLIAAAPANAHGGHISCTEESQPACDACNELWATGVKICHDERTAGAFATDSVEAQGADASLHGGHVACTSATQPICDACDSLWRQGVTICHSGGLDHKH